MNLDELNPGDIIRFKPAEYRVNLFGRDVSKEDFEVCYLKLNDSFPEAIIQVPMIEKQKDIHGKEFITKERYIKYGVHAKEILLVKHLDRNNKRWRWITDRIGIGECYPTLYYSCIANNEFARFNWQTWGNDGYYHCPFCDKQLNTVNEIEDTKPQPGAKIEFKSCDCEGWTNRYNEYKKYVKAKARMEKLENKIMESTELPFKKNHDNGDI